MITAHINNCIIAVNSIMFVIELSAINIRYCVLECEGLLIAGSSVACVHNATILYCPAGYNTEMFKALSYVWHRQENMLCLDRY